MKIEFRGLAFIGEDSREALEHTLTAAEDDRLWQMTDLLFQSQGAENSDWVSDDLLGDSPRRRGSIRTSSPERAGSSAVDGQIQEDAASAGRLGVDGTPAFFVGRSGGQLRRVNLTALTPDEFGIILDEELAAAE